MRRSATSTEFERHCARVGHPPVITPFESASSDRYISACRRFPVGHFREIFARWGSHSDLGNAERHWPVLALIVDATRHHDHRMRAAEPHIKLAEMRDLLRKIAAAAETLGDNMAKLRDLSDRPIDWAYPDYQAHLNWISARVAQGVIGYPGPDVPATEEHFAGLFVGTLGFIKNVAFVEIGARAAEKALDPSMFKRSVEGPHSNQQRLVWMCAKAWESLTGRPASANKVARKDGSEPDFVQFVAAMAAIASVPRPSWKQILDMLKRLRTTEASEI